MEGLGVRGRDAQDIKVGLKPEDYEFYKPAVMKALQTLTPAP